MYIHARYTHIEGECPFISFDDLLERLEDLVCDTAERVYNGPLKDLLMDVNPVGIFFIDLYSGTVINKL